jgi:hypothetical protein
MPYKVSNCNYMTNAEVHRRLRSVKRMLSNKNQVLLYQGQIFSLPIEVEDEATFYSALSNNKVAFNKSIFLSEIIDRPNLFDRDSFSFCSSIQQYIQDNCQEICKSFSVTAMLFTKYRKQDKVEKHVIICLGSIYHAPRIFYRDELSGRVIYQKSTEYLDLF